MFTKVHQCVNLYRDVMEGLIDNAVRINKEMGMLFYQDKQGNCTIGDICTGEQCSVSLVPRRGEKIIGDFHVHTPIEEGSTLSVVDFVSCLHYQEIKKKHTFMCIGSKKDGIRCFSVTYCPEVDEFVNSAKKWMRNVHIVKSQIRYAANYIDRKNLYFKEYFRPETGVYIPEIIDDVLSKQFDKPYSFGYGMIGFSIKCKLIIDYLGKVIEHECTSDTYNIYNHTYNVYTDHLNMMIEFTDLFKSNYSKMLHEHKL